MKVNDPNLDHAPQPLAPVFCPARGSAADGWAVRGWLWKDATLSPDYIGPFPTRSDAEADWAETHFKANLRRELDALDLMLDGPMTLPAIPGDYQPQTRSGAALLVWSAADAAYEAELERALDACRALGASIETTVRETVDFAALPGVN